MRLYQLCTLTSLLRLCIPSLAAPPIVPSTSLTAPLSITNNAESPTLNYTLSNLQLPLPEEPFTYPVPNTQIAVKFKQFGLPIPTSNVLQCLLVAANDVNAHFATPHAPVGENTLKCTSASVRLVLYPAKVQHSITWAKWGAAIRGITDFVTTYRFVDLDFYVLDEEFGGGVVAGGLISNR